MRIGIGYDIHRFDGKKRPLKLGGVAIPSLRGLAGHSDADVLLHALTDALLGAMGAPDIGEQFPSSDPRYRDADSRRFLEAARILMRRQRWAVGNIDATVIADTPRLEGHKRRIREAISRLLAIPPTLVSIKAKTTEGFGPGREGIAAQAVVLLKKTRQASSKTRRNG